MATNEIVAVKIIKLEPGEELDEVLNEVNFLRDCTNANIVSYIGCYMKRGQVRGQKIVWVRIFPDRFLVFRLSWNIAVEGLWKLQAKVVE